MNFAKICAIHAAVNCLNAGQTFEQIADSAKKSPATIRRWVRKAGFRKVNDVWRVSSF